MDPIPVSPARTPGRFLIPGLIAAVTIATFLPSLRGEFLLWDDDANFLFNPNYRGFSPDHLRWMFTNAFGHYMPLTWLTLALDYVLWGMNPTGYHATNMAIHALNAVLFFYVLRTLLQHASPDLPRPKTTVAAAAGALFFSIHPLRVETVAWITERRDVLSGAFFLLTVLAYLRMTAAPEASPARWKWLAVSAVLFATMLLSKTMGLTLPLLLLILDVYPLRRFSRAGAPALLKEKIPLFLLMLGALVMLSISAGKAGGMSDRANYPLLQSLARPGYALTFYLAKTLLPIGLSPLYWYRPELGLPQVAGWIIVLTLTAVLVLRRRSFPAGLAAWIGYGILIAPGSGLVSLGSFVAADHYSYVACLPFAAVAAGMAALSSRRGSPLAVGGVCAALLLGLATMSWSYCRVWGDSVSLWSRAIELEPDVYFCRTNLGRALAARGEWDRAIGEYTRSIDLEPRWFETYGHRARARLQRGDPSGAVEDASLAIRLQPDWAEAFNTRGLALSKLARTREAIADFTLVLELRPQSVEARINRAADRAKLGDVDGAAADLDEAIRLDPQPSIHLKRGLVRGMKGDLGGAAADFQRALDLAPPDWPSRPQVEEYLRRARADLPH
jgi:tetratricopeptide (TPR) repeat protein